ncbi:hypothetical protein BT96DRAFT_780675, partial [Gymnopus androsaceus JB14]
SVAEIVVLSRKSSSTIYNILHYYQEYGTLSNPLALAHEGKRVLNEGDLNYIVSILQANPLLFSDEIHQKLVDYRQVDVCLPTISRAIRDLSITHKKVSYEALQRNDLVRATWLGKHGDIPKEYIIWLDESGFNGRDHQRDHGWAFLGAACVQR